MLSSPSGPPTSSSSSRRFVWLAVAIVAGCVLWSIGWFLAAAKMEDHLPETLARLSGAQAKASCESPEIRGYPFRFGVFCQTLSYADAGGGVTAISGPLRSAAQFYRPGHVVAEIDGPLAVTAPGLDARLDWQVLQASVNASPQGINRGSLDGRTVSFDIDGAGLTRKLAMQAGRITAHVRKNGADLDVALRGEELRNNASAGLAAKALSLEATLPAQAGVLDAPFRPVAAPFEIRLHRLAVELDETSSLEISGPLEIGVDRRASGTLDVTARNHQQILALAATMNPELSSLINRFAPMIETLDTSPGDGTITLKLTIRSNEVSLGLFPLGRLPDF